MGIYSYRFKRPFGDFGALGRPTREQFAPQNSVIAAIHRFSREEDSPRERELLESIWPQAEMHFRKPANMYPT